MQRLHARDHLEAHDRGEPALLQLGLDQGDQVVGALLVLLGVRVAGHAEELAAHDLHAGEEQVEVVAEHLLERHEALLRADPEEAARAGSHGHLDARQRKLGVPGVAQRHQQVEREVRDEGEGVRGVDRLGRHQRVDRAHVLGADLGLLLLRELVVVHQVDLLGPQQLHEAHGQLLHAHPQAADGLVAVLDLARGRAAVDGDLLHAGLDLLLEAADALHEELVEVRGGDGQKLHALEQRRALVLRLVQHAAVEGEPGQFAIEVEGGVEQARAAGTGRRTCRLPRLSPAFSPSPWLAGRHGFFAAVFFAVTL